MAQQLLAASKAPLARAVSAQLSAANQSPTTPVSFDMATYQDHLDSWREALREKSARPGGITDFYLSAWRQVIASQVEEGSMSMDDGLMAAAAMLEVDMPKAREEGLALLSDLQACGGAASVVVYARAMLTARVSAEAVAEALQLLQQVAQDPAVPQTQAQAVALLGDAKRLGVSEGEPDVQGALNLYMQAAALGLPSANLLLGLWYEGVSPPWASAQPNMEVAAFYYTQGLSAGCMRCLAALGALHLYGRLHSSDRSAGLEMLEVAADSGEPHAQEMLRRRAAAAAMFVPELAPTEGRPPTGWSGLNFLDALLTRRAARA